jgi:hypothetical protein
MRPWASGFVHGRGGKTHGRGRWERLPRPSTRLCASELAFHACSLLSSSPSSPDSNSGRRVLDAEGVGDALVGSVGLAVDAVSVDLEQDGAPVGKVLDFAWARFTSADVTS